MGLEEVVIMDTIPVLKGRTFPFKGIPDDGYDFKGIPGGGWPDGIDEGGLPDYGLKLEIFPGMDEFPIYNEMSGGSGGLMEWVDI